jgi:predicted phage terminase large subunit-like protein
VVCGLHPVRADDPLGRVPGELLWTEYLNQGDILAIKNNVADQRTWSALYQQRPSAEEGTYFKAEWLRFYDEKPKHLLTYGASDYAVSKDGGDFTTHLVVGIDPEDNIYILDIWRGQVTTDISTDAFLDMVKLHEPLMWAIDADLMTKSIGPFVNKQMADRKIFCAMHEMSLGRNDKPMRARSFQARTAQGKVYLPSTAEWVGELKREMLAFPAGKHDDQVDCLGLIGRLLDQMVGGSVPQEPKRTVRDGYHDRDTEDAEDNWKMA